MFGELQFTPNHIAKTWFLTWKRILRTYSKSQYKNWWQRKQSASLGHSKCYHPPITFFFVFVGSKTHCPWSTHSAHWAGWASRCGWHHLPPCGGKSATWRWIVQGWAKGAASPIEIWMIDCLKPWSHTLAHQRETFDSWTLTRSRNCPWLRPASCMADFQLPTVRQMPALYQTYLCSVQITSPILRISEAPNCFQFVKVQFHQGVHDFAPHV